MEGNREGGDNGSTNGGTEERSKNGGGSTAGSDRKPRTKPDSRCSWFSIRFVRVRRFATPSNRSSPFVLCFLRSSVCETVISAFSVSSTASYSNPQESLAERPPESKPDLRAHHLPPGEPARLYTGRRLKDDRQRIADRERGREAERRRPHEPNRRPVGDVVARECTDDAGREHGPARRATTEHRQQVNAEQRSCERVDQFVRDLEEAADARDIRGEDRSGNAEHERRHTGDEHLSAGVRLADESGARLAAHEAVGEIDHDDRRGRGDRPKHARKRRRQERGEA